MIADATLTLKAANITKADPSVSSAPMLTCCMIRNVYQPRTNA